MRKIFIAALAFLAFVGCKENQKGTEVEQERDANIRKNTVYSRKYGIFAFTDATQAVKLTKGA